MFFSRSLLVAALASPFLVFAQSGPNPFTLTPDFTAKAGSTAELKWTPTTGGQVNLILRQGSGSDLTTVDTIASNIDNTGTYSWKVPTDAIRGSDYTIEIVNSADPTETNYSGRFILDSSNVATPTISSTSATSTSASSSDSTALTPSAFPSAPGLTIVTTPYHSTTRTTSSGTRTNTATSTDASSTDASSTTSTPTSSSDPDLQASGTTNTDNAAPRATAMVGMLGAVALGALAL